MNIRQSLKRIIRVLCQTSFCAFCPCFHSVAFFSTEIRKYKCLYFLTPFFLNSQVLCLHFPSWLHSKAQTKFETHDKGYQSSRHEKMSGAGSLSLVLYKFCVTWTANILRVKIQTPCTWESLSHDRCSKVLVVQIV